jgi:hypothetical protein
MPGLDTLTATGTEIIIGGEAYRLRPLNRADWGLIDERIKAGRTDPIEVVARLAANAPKDVASELYARAYDDAMRANVVSVKELDTWRFTLDGMVFQFYLQVRKEHRDITEARAAELLEQFGQEHLERITTELLKRFPEATPQDVAAIASQQEDKGMAVLIGKAAGLPAGNSPAPETPGTPTSHSTGNDGTPN